MHRIGFASRKHFLMNIFTLPQNFSPEKPPPIVEQVDTLYRQNGVTVERILSRGHTTGWQTLKADEWVVLLTGEADIEFANGEIVTLGMGDTLLLPAGTRHRVARTTECVWLCVHVARPDPPEISG